MTHLAASQGDVIAVSQLAYYYANGIGVTKDLNRARILLENVNPYFNTFEEYEQRWLNTHLMDLWRESTYDDLAEAWENKWLRQ